jgi:hypothetical protein
MNGLWMLLLVGGLLAIGFYSSGAGKTAEDREAGSQVWFIVAAILAGVVLIVAGQ